MRHILKSAEVKEVFVDSAGTAGYHIGKGPDPRMSEELRERGITVTGSAQQFKVSHFDEFDLIIPMDLSNEKNILKLARSESDRAKVKPFMSYCAKFTNTEVPDPYYEGQGAFSQVVDMMYDGCEGILKSIQG